MSLQILGCGLVSIDRYAWHGIVYAKASNLFQKCKQNCCTFVWFSPRIGQIQRVDVSNERKQISAQIYDLLFFSSGYTLRVMME